MRKAGRLLGRFNARNVPVHPLLHCAVGIVVEGVHANVAEAGCLGVGIPTFPDGGSTLMHAVQPGRILGLEQQRVCKVVFAELSQHLVEDAGADKTGGELIAVVDDLLLECRNGGRAPFGQEQIVAQCQQVAGLRAHLGVQIPLGVAVDAAEVIANLLKQAVVVCGAIRPVDGAGHGSHVAGIQCVVRDRDVACIGRLVSQPVTVGRVRSAQLGSRQPIHIALHGGVMLPDDVGVGIHFPHGIRYDDARIAPCGAAPADHAHLRDDVRVHPVLCLRVARVLEPLVEEAVHIGIVGGGAAECLRVARPAQTLIALRAVGRDGEVIAALSPKNVGNQPVDIGV